MWLGGGAGDQKIIYNNILQLVCMINQNEFDHSFWHLEIYSAPWFYFNCINFLFARSGCRCNKYMIMWLKLSILGIMPLFSRSQLGVEIVRNYHFTDVCAITHGMVPQEDNVSSVLTFGDLATIDSCKFPKCINDTPTGREIGGLFFTNTHLCLVINLQHFSPCGKIYKNHHSWNALSAVGSP